MQRLTFRWAAAVAAGALALSVLPAVPGAAASGEVTTQVISGVEGDPDAFPFLVAVGDRSGFQQSGMHVAQFCGGTLVAPTKVITAAHCVSGLTATETVVSPMSSDGLLSSMQTAYQVTQIAVHPRYDGDTDKFDLAVLTTRSPVPGIPLAVAGPGDARMSAGSTVHVAGWGTDSSDGQSYPDRFRSGRLSMVGDSECAQGGFTLGEVRFSGWGSSLDPVSMVCAAGASRTDVVDSCSGDSGGPLVALTPYPPVLVGVVSWGAKRCGAPVAGVYADVTAAVGFLARNGVPVTSSSTVPVPRVAKVTRLRESAVVQVSVVGAQPLDTVVVESSRGVSCIAELVTPAAGSAATGMCTLEPVGVRDTFTVRASVVREDEVSPWSTPAAVAAAARPQPPALRLVAKPGPTSARLVMHYRTGAWEATQVAAQCTSPGRPTVTLSLADGISQTVSGFRPATVYFCRSVVTTELGSLNGDRLRFRTAERRSR